jgi:integrase
VKPIVRAVEKKMAGWTLVASHFLSENGTQRYPSYSGLRCAWNRILHDLRKEEKDRMTIHRLRHTYATLMMSGGMSIVSLMKILGHKDIRMTLIYGDVSQEKIHYEYKKLDTNQYHITKEPRRFLSILKRLKIIEKDLKAFGIEEKMPVTPQAE